MASKKSSRRNQLTFRQKRLVHERAKGKTYAEAAIAAGYSPKLARQSGYQAMQQIRGRVPDLMERNGLDENTQIYKYLLPLLEAEETIFTQFKGKFKDQRQVAALTVRLNALKEAFRLRGSYAPRDPKEAAPYGVKMVICDIPGPPGEFDVFKGMLPPKSNGNKPPSENNGHE